MQFAFWLLIAFAPGIFWLWFFVRKSTHRPDPRRIVVFTFFAGMVSTIPAAILESLFLDESVFGGAETLTSVTFSMLLVVGPVEELSKYFAVRLGAFRSRYFDEPTDGLLYAAAASLGFASLENLIYVLQFGPAVMIVRAPLSTLAHVIFASFWGYALGMRTTGNRRAIGGTVRGIAVAALLHGAFNVSVFVNPLIAVAIVIIGGFWTVRRFELTQRLSPFRYKRNYPKVRCISCGHLVSVADSFCRFCGADVAPGSSPALICSRCGTENRADARFCVSCGDRFLSRA